MISSLRDRTEAKLHDSSGTITPDDIESNINEAINRYSRVRPDELVVDVTGNGTHDYDLPADWVEGFSGISAIEYPVGKVPPDLLDGDEYAIYQTPTKKQIRLIIIAPAATEAFRLSFTVPRDETTILETDMDAVANLAASLCLEDMANHFLQTTDPTIMADSVNYRTKSQEAAARAKQLMKLYKEHLGLKEDDVVDAAAAVGSQELNYPGGMDRLTHPRYPRRLR